MPAAPTPTGDQWLVNYYSNAIALDFRGGEKLSGRGNSEVKSVGEILLLDADGNLVVHNELDDKADRDKILAAETGPTHPGAPAWFPAYPNPAARWINSFRRPRAGDDRNVINRVEILHYCGKWSEFR